MARMDPKFGLLIPDSRFSVANQEAVGVATTSSSYTQAGPQPGAPVPEDAASRWRPYMSGAQTADIEVITIDGGYAGRDGASILYREDGEGALLRRGWDEPNCLVQVSSPLTGSDWSTGEYVAAAVCAIPRTGIIVVVVTGATTGGEVYRYNPRTETWAAGYDFAAAGITVSDSQLGLVWDEEAERLILYYGEGGPSAANARAFYSEDYGDTWIPYTLGHFNESQFDGGRMSIATGPGAWVAFTGDDDVSQWQSTDRGITWEQVNRVTTFAAGQNFEVVRLASGGFLLLYIANGGAIVNSRRLGGASSNFGDASAVSTGIDGNTMGACVDDDGTVYVYALDSTTGDVRCSRSTDEGASWEVYEYRAAGRIGGGSSGTALLRPTASCGQVHVVLIELSALWTSSVTAPFVLASFGGWSNVEAGSLFAGFAERKGRTGWGRHTNASGTTNLGACWIPIELPDAGVSPDWAKTGTGDISLTGGPYGEIATTAAQRYYEHTWSALGTMAGHVHVTAVSGGSASANDIAIVARQANGVYDYRLAIRLTTTGITAVDVHGSSTVTASVATTGGVYIRWMTAVALGGGSAWASVWYRLAGSTTWTEIIDAAALTEKGSAREANDGVAWGHIASSTATSRWSVVGVAGNGWWHYGLRTLAQINAANPRVAGEPIGLNWGHPIPSRNTAAYPIPDATAATEELGRVAASGGPTKVGEVVDLPVGYQYPATAIYPSRSPSPSQYWESTTATEAKWVWDLGVASWTGDAMGVAIIGAYARQWALEWSATGTSWTTLGTLDLAVGTGLLCTRLGNTITPRTNTTDVTRYIGEGELVGGYCILQTTTTGTDLVDEFGASADATVTGTLTDDTNGITGVDDSNYATTGTVSLSAGDYLHYIVRVRRDAPSRDNFLISRSSASDPGFELRVTNTPTAYTITAATFGSGGSAVGVRSVGETVASAGDDLWIVVDVRDASDPGTGGIRIRTFDATGAKLQDTTTYGGTKQTAPLTFGSALLGRDTASGADASEVEGDGLQWALVRHTAALSDADVTAFITTGTPSAGTEVYHYRRRSTSVAYSGHRITANSGGYWTDDTAQRVRLRAEDAGTTDSLGTCDIIAPSGVLVAYPTSIVTARYWRVRAAASQVTPGGVYRAALIVPGRVVGIGAAPGWDYSHRMELSRRLERRRDGTPDVEELGPPRRVRSYGWTEGLVLRTLRGAQHGGTWADHVATSTGLGIGTAEDAAHTLWGLLEHSLASGSTPCVLLPALPAATGSITDPSLWHYGVLVSDSLGITGVVGEEGVSEVVRLDSATFEEIR